MLSYFKSIIAQMKQSSPEVGFTLIEVLVATLVFSVVVLATTTMFVQVLSNQRWAFAAQHIQENGQYIMELMAREIRVSDIENQDSPDCSLTSLTINHPVNGTVVYSLDEGVLDRTAGGVTGALSSSDVKFSRLNFCVMGSNPTDDDPPRVTIIAAIQNATGQQIITFNLQTTITSRNAPETP